MGDQEENTSPQPLPRPDIDPMSEYSSDPHKLTLLESPTYEKAGTYQVNLATVYEHENKADNYNMDGPELDEKVHLGEKYLFPYTGRYIIKSRNCSTSVNSSLFFSIIFSRRRSLLGTTTPTE